jgi:ketosteroid isomerase-like protein
MEVLAQYSAAWERGEPDEAFAWYADDVRMHLPGRSAMAGSHSGKEAVVACIRTLLARTTAARVDVEVIDEAVSRERVFLLLHERAQRGDEVLDLNRVNTYRVVGDRIVEIQIFEADQYDVDQFFG